MNKNNRIIDVGDEMSQWTPGPWELCRHLMSVEDDRACPCGYRGVIYGQDGGAICQPGHEVERGEEGLEPGRYPRAVEIANAHLIAAAPDLYEALLNIENDDGRIPSTIWALRNSALAKARGGK